MSHAPVTPVSARSGRLLHVLLVTGLLGGVLALGGCGDSATGQASKAAVSKTVDASKLLASAGQPRPTQSLIDSLNVPLDAANLKNRIREAQSGSNYKADVEGGPETLGADLKRASSLISDALSAKSEGLDKSSQAFLGTTQGYIQINQALVGLDAMFAAYADAMNQATQINRTTGDVNVLGQEIVTLQASITDPSKAYDDKITAAQKTLDDAKADADAKSKTVEQLKSEIDSLRDQTAAQYSKSDKQIDAANQQTGMASIGAYNAGVKQRDIADDLAAQMATKLPRLTEAQTDSELAARKVEEAQQKLDALQASKKTLQIYVDAVNKQIASVQDEIKQKIDEPNFGLKAQAAAFATSAGILQANLNDTLKQCHAAQQSFKAGADAYSQYASRIEADPAYAQKADGSVDPLVKAVRRPEVLAFLKLNQSAAAYQGAIVQLMAAGVAEQQQGMQDALNQAYKAAGVSDQAPAAFAKADDLTNAAVKALKDDAVTLANAGATAPGLPTNSPAAWIGYSLKAIAYQTLYDATRFGNAPDTEAKTEAQTAAAAAKQRNPSLLLPGIGDAG